MNAEMLPDALVERAGRLVADLTRAGLTLATAESCTGGLIAACVTEVAGASEVLERGFVTYSNAAKVELLGVPSELVARQGAVSAPVAEAMAAGALAHSAADLAVAVTGVAGPGGGTVAKPVGLVFLGGARRGAAPMSERHLFSGDRRDIRLAAVAAAFDLIAKLARA